MGYTRLLRRRNAAVCYSRWSATTTRHPDAPVSPLDAPRQAHRAMHLMSVRPNRPPKYVSRTQFRNTQRSLGDRPLLVLLLIPTRTTRLPIAHCARIPTQLVHLPLETFCKNSEPRRPTECIVGLLNALKTHDVGLERLIRNPDLLAQSIRRPILRERFPTKDRPATHTHFSIEASTSSRPRRTEDREPDSLLASDACCNRSSWCAVTYPVNSQRALERAH